jgi:hypothetical protein
MGKKNKKGSNNMQNETTSDTSEPKVRKSRTKIADMVAEIEQYAAMGGPFSALVDVAREKQSNITDLRSSLSVEKNGLKTVLKKLRKAHKALTASDEPRKRAKKGETATA